MPIDPATQCKIDGLKQALQRPNLTTDEQEDIRDAIHSLAFNAVNADWIYVPPLLSPPHPLTSYAPPEETWIMSNDPTSYASVLNGPGEG